MSPVIWTEDDDQPLKPLAQVVSEVETDIIKLRILLKNARIYGARVHLLHVITPPAIASEYPVDTEAITKSLEDVPSHDVKSLVRRLERRGLSLTSELQTGDAQIREFRLPVRT
jgi:hypothetical protein